MLNNAMHKTKLTQNKKVKHTSNTTKKKKEKKKEGEREKKWLNHLEPFSFHTLKPFKFERNMWVVRRSPIGAKEDGNWFWFPDEIILLLCWVANHL